MPHFFILTIWIDPSATVKIKKIIKKAEKVRKQNGSPDFLHTGLKMKLEVNM